MTNKKGFSGKFLKLIGGFSIAWGAFITIFAGLGSIVESGSKFFELIWAILIIGVVPLVWGMALWKRGKAKLALEPPFDAALERKTLVAAEHRSGVLTITTLALDANLSIDDSAMVLEYMTSRGLAVPEANDDGVVEYKFIEMLGK